MNPENLPPKTRAALVKLIESVQVALNAGAEPNTHIATATTAIKRAAKRESVAAPCERVEIPATNGPTLEFTGRLLWEDEWQSVRTDQTNSLELWQTEGGNYVTASYRMRGNEAQTVHAEVIEPCGDDAATQARVLAAMGWNQNARRFAIRTLGWSFRRDVD